jgi:hypothetical protein
MHSNQQPHHKQPTPHNFNLQRHTCIVYCTASSHAHAQQTQLHHEQHTSHKLLQPAAPHLHHALHCQLPHTCFVTLPQHSHKRPQRVLLVREVLQLSACQQLGHQLAQRVHSIQRHSPAEQLDKTCTCQVVSEKEQKPGKPPLSISQNTMTCRQSQRHMQQNCKGTLGEGCAEQLACSYLCGWQLAPTS